MCKLDNPLIREAAILILGRRLKLRHLYRGTLSEMDASKMRVIAAVDGDIFERRPLLHAIVLAGIVADERDQDGGYKKCINQILGKEWPMVPECSRWSLQVPDGPCWFLAVLEMSSDFLCPNLVDEFL